MAALRAQRLVMSEDPLAAGVAGPSAVRGGVQRIAGYLAGVLITLGSAIVLFRHLGVDDSGRYVLVLSIVTIAGGMTDAGLSSIGIHELAVREGGDRATFMRSLTGLRIGLSLAGGAAACAYAAIAGLGGTVVLGTAVAALGVLTTNLQSTYATALMADLKLGWVTIIELLRQASTAALIFAFAALGGRLVPFLAIGPAAGALALGLTLWRVRGSVPLVPSFDRRAWRSLLRRTLPFALAAAVTAIYFRLGVVLLAALSDERQSGLFGASFRAIEVLILVPQMLITTALPIFSRAARDDHDRLAYGLGLVVQALLIVGAATSGALLVGAPFIIDVVAGSKFEGAVPVLELHAIALFASFAGGAWGYALLALDRQRDVLTGSLVGIVVLVIALLVLVPSYGARGAAGSMIAGESALGLTTFMLTRRAGLHVRVDGVGRIVLGAAVATVPALLLPALPGAAAAVAAFVGMLLLTRAVPDELLEIVRR